MATEETPTPNPGAPTSWRDVYQLVQDAEKRLTTQINDGFARQTSVSADHEVRIRILEATDQKQSGQVSGGVAVLSTGKQLLLMAISGGSLIIAIAGYFAK